MSTLLIAIIYLAFISLGLPDSLLGSAWPEMYQQMEISISSVGIVTMIMSLMTIFSSLFTGKLVNKIGTPLVVIFSTLLTIFGLIGFALTNHFWVLCLLAVPYGLGAGAIDASLNNYVALNYSSRHMSWLHCFWGVGTIISPYVMSYALTTTFGWSLGYLLIGIIQIAILIILIITLPVWKKINNKSNNIENDNSKQLGVLEVFKIKGVIFVLFGFLCYCAAESTIMLWSSTYLFEIKNISEEVAASYGSLVFIGVTIGRFVSGFISNKVGDKNMIRVGIFISIIGIILMMIPSEEIYLSLIGLIIIGLGFAPIYPCIIHATPTNFGEENSQSIIGIQMAFAYTGSTFMPPLFGLIAKYINVHLLPIYILFFVLITLALLEVLNKIIKKHQCN